MFTQAWFWISLSAFFFNSNFYYHKNKGSLNGASMQTQETISSIAMIGILIFWAIGLFVAEHWWQPLVAFGISMIGGGLLGALIDAILPRSTSTLIGAISPFMSIGLVISSYINWY
jgi:lipoprotein signal peptidase